MINFLPHRVVIALFRAAFAPCGGGRLVWALHFLLMAATLVGLALVNGWLELDRAVHAPTRLVRELWLPILFTLGYALVWLSMGTWRAFQEPGAVSLYPDIDDAWREAIAGLRRAGLEVADRPLVLIVGQPASHENDLVAALGVTPLVGPTPARTGAAVRVVADDEAIYVLCHDASLVSHCTERLVQRRAQRRARRFAETALAEPVESALPAKLRATAGETTTALAEPPAATASDTVDEVVALSPLFTADDATLAGDRMDHLLRLIARDREPVTPVDSIVVVFPCDEIADQVTSDNLAQAVRQDLDAVREAGVRCAVTAVGVDLQHVRGAGALLHALPADRRGRLFGATLPAEAMRSERAVRDAVGWMADTMTPALCRRLYEFQPDGVVTLEDNSAFHRFEYAISQHGQHIADALVAGLEGDRGDAWPLAGAFLVATGDSVGGSQAFGAGVLEVARSRATHVAWTDAALTNDARQRQLVIGGYATIAVAALAVAVGLIW